MFRSRRRLRPMAGAYAASVPTLISAAGAVWRGASDDDGSVATSDCGVSLMAVFSPLLIVAEMGMVMGLNCPFRNRRRTLTEQREQWVPLSTVASVLAFPRDCAQSLQDHSIGQCCGDVGMVVRGADFDHIHSDDRQLQTDPSHRIPQFACGQPTGLRGAGARRVPWIADVNVD